MIIFKQGNIFDSKCETLVNPINCVGVMGKGLALAFKNKFPKMYEVYRKDCALNKIKVGKVYPYYEGGNIRVLNFPTKNHRKLKSKVEYIEKGLEFFVNNYEKYGIKSIAFPLLGCGNGGLDWIKVKSLMVAYLEKLPINIEIYFPRK